jgi:hypothetical protein
MPTKNIKKYGQFRQPEGGRYTSSRTNAGKLEEKKITYIVHFTV